MSKSFNCPNCGAPLDYPGGTAATIPCPFCHNNIIIPEEVRTPIAAAAVTTSQPGAGPGGVMESPAAIPELAKLDALAAAEGLRDRDLRKIERARRKIIRHQVKEEERRAPRR